MKYIWILALLVLLCGCQGQRQAQRQEASTTIPTETATPTAVPPSPIGMFVTDILDTDEERVNNLKLCAGVLDGVQVEPGAEFSFNGTVGQRTAEKGYEKARILVEGHREYAIGGGICQISSTLYNAAAEAGMEILERHNHTNEVHYVEIGKDAAVSYGEQDFRFRNVLEVPITIGIVVENTQVKATIYKNVTKM
ncbi:MAG: VanW family protein [Clostridia bacterium]|nr:VanW family protein [Clostridia bacterium]